MLILNEQWLQTWLDKPIDVKSSHEFLLKQGFEVESLDPMYTSDIVVGEIVSVSKHPNADKLNVCRVSVGTNDDLQIVCGCSSVAPGLKVACARVGTQMADFTIEKRKLRGVESCGMLCSQSELGFKSHASGIWHLHSDAPVGESLDVYLQRSSYRYGIEITPNRGDCMSIQGMAREFAIGLGAKSQAPWESQDLPFLSLVNKKSIVVSDSAKPHVSMFHLVRLKRDPSKIHLTTPDWMQVRLLESGFTLHHLAVDVLNYVMLETGQPMHAYTASCTDDFSLDMGSGSELRLLNDESVVVDQKTLLIKNSGNPACIAGYMGGLDSASRPEDQAIFIEAAAFDATQVAYHCRRYAEHTQSGSRFERGIDFNFTRHALQRAINLLVQYGGFKPEYRLSYDVYQTPRDEISMPVGFPESVLGFSYSTQAMTSALEAVGCQVRLQDDLFYVLPPTWRNDLKLPETLVSELLRMQGMPDHTTHTMTLNSSTLKTSFSSQDALTDRVKSLMMGCGFSETYTYSFESDAEAMDFCHDESMLLKLANPISHMFNTMRTSLLPGLLKQVKKNLAKQDNNVRLFELGNCFINHKEGVDERLMLSACLTGADLSETWLGSSQLTFFHAKGLLEYLTASFSRDLAQKLSWYEGGVAGLHPHQSGHFVHGSDIVATAGLLHPQIAKKLKIKNKIYFISLNLDWLCANCYTEKYYSPVSKQPMMRRDLSLLVPHVISYDDIMKEIKANVAKCLKKVLVFDIYNGGQIPDGFYSMSIGLIFQDAVATLQDEELSPMLEKLMENLERKFNITPRGGK